MKRLFFAQCFFHLKLNPSSSFTGHRIGAASTPDSHQGAPPPLGNFSPPKHKHTIYSTLCTLMWSFFLIMLCVFTYWRDSKYGEPINGQSRQFYRSGASTPPLGGGEWSQLLSIRAPVEVSMRSHLSHSSLELITSHTRTQGQTCAVLDRCERANPLRFPRALKGVYRLLRPGEASPLRGTRLRGEFSPHGWVWPNICNAEVLTTGHMSNRKTNMRGAGFCFGTFDKGLHLHD